MRAWSSIAAAAILALLGFFAGGGPTWAAEVKVLSSNAMTDVMTDLVPEFERTTGHKVVATYEPTNAILTRLKAGEPADVVVLLRQSIDELKMTGKVVPGSEVDLAKTSLGIAVRAGAPKPDISTAEAFKEAMLKARSVALSEVGASGIQFRRVLERLGIAEAMQPQPAHDPPGQRPSAAPAPELDCCTAQAGASYPLPQRASGECPIETFSLGPPGRQSP